MVVLVLCVLGLAITGLKRSHCRSTTYFVLFGWFLIPTLLAYAGITQAWELRPPAMLLLMALQSALIPYLVFKTPIGRNLATALPQSALLGIQIIRFPLEVIMAAMACHQLLPLEMTFLGWNFDIFTGIVALPLAIWVAFRGEIKSRLPILIFNVLGLTFATWAAGMGVLSTPSPAHLLDLSMDNRYIAHFPWIGLPFVILPMAFIAHLVSIQKALHGSSD
jgi:hypothetical protein